MTVFELLGIEQGDAVVVDNPFSNNGEREVIPLALSKNGISIRAIDCRYGDIRYVCSNWSIRLSDGSTQLLEDFPYIKQKLNEWDSKKHQELASLENRIDEVALEDIKREFAPIDEILNTLNIENLQVAVTGTFPMSRNEIKALLASKGAKVTGSVSRKTDYLFMGNSSMSDVSSKVKQAHDFGVKIISI
ncbi:BRCT domain-containing protein [Vibrio aerogenes]|uniref:BRCT domain-containing protein n=1 Tax=Vibrio aerogenes TaxID=92172 RepID=UPI0039EE7AC2